MYYRSRRSENQAKQRAEQLAKQAGYGSRYTPRQLIELVDIVRRYDAFRLNKRRAMRITRNRIPGLRQRAARQGFAYYADDERSCVAMVRKGLLVKVTDDGRPSTLGYGFAPTAQGKLVARKLMDLERENKRQRRLKRRLAEQRARERVSVYTVDVRRVVVETVVVTARNESEARGKVEAGEGLRFMDNVRTAETLDASTWAVQRRDNIEPLDVIEGQDFGGGRVPRWLEPLYDERDEQDEQCG